MTDTVNVGAAANDGTGDNLRVGGQALNAAIQAIVNNSIPAGTITNSMLSDGSVSTAKVIDKAITNAKLADMAEATFKMRAAGAGTGVSIDGTAMQALQALSTAPSYATRAEIKALDTTKVGSVELRELGREGSFIWRSGDYSTNVAADTAEGIYIKADAIAASSGAWVRAYSGRVLGTWFGMVADWNGTTGTDSSPGVTAALATGRPVIVPKGRYRLNSTTAISGTGQSLFCEPGTVMNYLGTGAAMTLTGNYHQVVLGELTAQNGTNVIRFWDFNYSRVFAEAVGVCSGAPVYHDEALQTGSAGNSIFDILNLSAGSCPYGYQIEANATHTLEGNLFRAKVIFSATTASVKIGTSGRKKVRWNRFDIAPDAQGITPILVECFDDQNHIYLHEWQGVPAGTHVRFNTGTVGNFLTAGPGVQGKLNIVDNGSNCAIYPGDGQRYVFQQGAAKFSLDDNSVGMRFETGGAHQFFAGGTEKLRISAAGFTRPDVNLPAFLPAAWASIAISGGTPSLQAGGNVASITDNGPGDFTLNFTSAMPDTNYAVFGTCMYTGDSQTVTVIPGGKATGSVRVYTAPQGGAAADVTQFYIMVMR